MKRVCIYFCETAEEFTIDVPDGSIEACYNLSKTDCRISYWAKISNDPRFYNEDRKIKSGSMIWNTDTNR